MPIAIGKTNGPPMCPMSICLSVGPRPNTRASSLTLTARACSSATPPPKGSWGRVQALSAGPNLNKERSGMRAMLSSLLLLVALVTTGCYDDDEEYIAQSENCAVVEYGLGETYTLCCRLNCTAE